eukprot:5335036-Pleurochrysis_carterae.AAC.1
MLRWWSEYAMRRAFRLPAIMHGRRARSSNLVFVVACSQKPRYGHKYVLVLLTLCSLISSVTVVASRRANMCVCGSSVRELDAGVFARKFCAGVSSRGLLRGHFWARQF